MACGCAPARLPPAMHPSPVRFAGGEHHAPSSAAAQFSLGDDAGAQQGIGDGPDPALVVAQPEVVRLRNGLDPAPQFVPPSSASWPPASAAMRPTSRSNAVRPCGSRSTGSHMNLDAPPRSWGARLASLSMPGR